MDTKNTSRPVVGKYILDTLSVGMYNNPLMLLREYIQNSVDAIDEMTSRGKLRKGDARIDIDIDGRSRSIRISDNGIGLSANSAKGALHDIGRSLKKITSSRGFRGIGRLGGLGYCDNLRFTTKTVGEETYSTSTWDCKRLSQLIKEDDDVVKVSDIIPAIAEFKVLHYAKNPIDHFFVVEMTAVKSPRDVLLSVPIIKAYLSQVAPVPFNRSTFTYADQIEQKLRTKVPKYDTYPIYVNGDQIFKQYSDTVPLGKETKDKIRAIEFIELGNGKGPLGYGWLAKLDLLGSINSSSLMDGIRLRAGNILIGDKDIFSYFFREKRFNSYLVGEIHTVEHRLIPNSRRDDFEDNEIKDEFCDCFVKAVGLPYSKKIREASADRSKENQTQMHNKLIEKAGKLLSEGFIAKAQKDKVIAELKDAFLKNNTPNEDITDLINKIQETFHFLNKSKIKLPPSKRNLMTDIFDIIYKECSNKKEAEKIIKKIANTSFPS